MIAGDMVIVIRDTVDVREQARDRLDPVAAGQFGRVLRTEGRFAVVALAEEPKPHVVTIDQTDVEDMDNRAIRQAVSRRER